MKSMKFLILILCLLGLVAAGVAQNAEVQKSPVAPSSSSFGYLDPKTGIFHSLVRQPRSVEEPAITPTTGRIQINVTITVAASLPANAVIECEAFGGVDDPTEGEFSNTFTITATRSGNKATCSMPIPYIWYLATPGSDTVVFDLEVSATAGTTGTAGYYSETFSAPQITMKVPANGAITVENVTTTI